MEKPSPGPAQLADHQFEQALAALGADSASREEKIQMLMEILFNKELFTKSTKKLMMKSNKLEKAKGLQEIWQIILS